MQTYRMCASQSYSSRSIVIERQPHAIAIAIGILSNLSLIDCYDHIPMHLIKKRFNPQRLSWTSEMTRRYVP